MQRKLILATALTLVCAVGARADYATTQVTLVEPYGGAKDVSALVNGAGGLGAGLSYTVASGTAVGSAVYATGADLLGSYKLYDGTTGTFQSEDLVLTYAIQGNSIAPVNGAAFSAMFNKGVFAIYAVSSFNAQNETTWGLRPTAGSTLLYSATLAPPQATLQGSLGDQSFVGQTTTGQNQASFFVSSGTQSLGALVAYTLSNPETLFAPPQPFVGLQGEISEVNSLTGAYKTTDFPTNTQLDANFSTLAALPNNGQDLTTGQFAANNYTGTANKNGPNTLQEISVTLYPIQSVPEPASILLLSFGALGLGLYTRRQKKVVPV